MKLTKLFTKTRKEVPKDETAPSAILLARGGFIFKNMAGVYSLLPLGVRVMKKIEQIIREEIDAIGGQEVHLNILQDPAVWRKSGRFDEAKEVMFQFKDQNDRDYGLGFTHEEVVAQIATQHIDSYKDLPKYVYQIQTKFRNEPRVQAGILRGREFGMKDLYSLAATEDDLKDFYEMAAEAYLKIFKRLGLQSVRTKASGGLFSKYSDEFQVISDVGEDTIFVCPQNHLAVNKEIIAQEDKQCQECKKQLVEKRAIEVGNIFKLGTRFSQPLGLYFTDKDGSRKPVVMGSYGIGTGRAMAAIVEVHHDEKGIQWPSQVAPFAIHLVGINKDSQSVYDKLHQQGIEVIYDDRKDASAGEKLADADLLGCPIRAVVSEKTGDKVELKRRNQDKTEIISLDKLVDVAQDL